MASLPQNKLMAEVVGLAFGDGSLTKVGKSSLRFQLRGDVNSDREHYEQFIIPLFTKHITFPLIRRKVSTVTSKPPYPSFGIAIQSSVVGNALHELGIPIGRKQELPVPKWIKENKEFSKAFLRGLLDTDGSVFCKKNYTTPTNKYHRLIAVKIGITSKQLAEDISEMISSLGIRNDVRITKSKQANRKPCYHVKVSGNIHTIKWFKLIGSNNPKHLSKYQVWQAFGFCPPYTTLKQRKSFLSGELDPNLWYLREGAGVVKRAAPRRL